MWLSYINRFTSSFEPPVFHVKPQGILHLQLEIAYLTLAVRPIYHWTEPRVRAHVAICYAVFALLRILRFRYWPRNPEAPFGRGTAAG